MIGERSRQISILLESFIGHGSDRYHMDHDGVCSL